MTPQELCAWLREHSSGAYRPAADAADLIERLLSAPASTGREPAAWMIRTGHGTRWSEKAPLAEVAHLWKPLYDAPVAARELDVEAERREFEAWARAEEYDLLRDIDGPGYFYCTTDSAWSAWQARAARSAAQGTDAGITASPEAAPVSTEQAGDAISRVEQAKVDHLTALANRFYGKPIASGIAPSPNNSPVGADRRE